MEQVLALLAREERLLELLLHRVRVASLLLATERTRFLATTADEIHQAVDDLTILDAARAAQVAAVAQRHRLAGDPVTLQRLAAVVDARTRSRLLGHGERLRRLVAEVGAAVAHAEEQARLSLNGVRAVLARPSVGSGVVRPGGAG